MNEWLERHRGYLIVVLISFIGWAGTFFAVRRPAQGLVEILPPPTTTPRPTTTPAPTSTPVVLKVYVSGAVANPGVYALPEGSRVHQAVDAAGGLAADASEAGINLALPLADGQQVHVPRQSETPMPAPAISGAFASAPPAAGPAGLININQASADALTALPGIGPAIAARIVEYRNANGRFQSIDEIKNVRGIGDATFDKLKDLITVQ